MTAALFWIGCIAAVAWFEQHQQQAALLPLAFRL